MRRPIASAWRASCPWPSLNKILIKKARCPCLPCTCRTTTGTSASASTSSTLRLCAECLRPENNRREQWPGKLRAEKLSGTAEDAESAEEEFLETLRSPGPLRFYQL